MISLYQKAENFRREARLLRLIRHEDHPKENDFEISPREGEEILDHLDEVVIRKKINVNNKTFSFHSQKSDVIFPAFVNIIVLVVVVLGTFLFAYFSGEREKSIISNSGIYVSTEGRLIEKLKEETEQQLLIKDSEIAETMKKLEEINAERNQLQMEMDLRIQVRENELRDVLNQTLATERQKLRETGFSSADIEQQLAQIKIDKNRENEEKMAAFILETTEETKQREKALIEMKENYERLLSEKQNEQLALRTELKAREERLLEQLQRQSEESETARTEISENLDRLRKQQQNEQLVLDQIQNFYKQINIDLGKTDYNDALIKLEALKQYISQESIAGLPIMEGRRDVELFIIDSIKKLIENEQSGNDPDTAMLVDNAARLTEVSGIVKEADELYRTGDMEGASLLYLQAFSRIPVLRESYDKLTSITNQSINQELQNLEGKIQLAESNLLLAKRELNEYEQRISRLNKTVEEQQAYEAYRKSLTNRITAAQLSEDELTDTKTENPRDILPLLQAKLMMKQILNSESVKMEYPELYESVEEYFTAFGEEKKKEGEYSTMRDIITFINILSNSEVDLNAELPWSDADSDLEKALYTELLEKLRRLIEKTG